MRRGSTQNMCGRAGQARQGKASKAKQAKHEAAGQDSGDDQFDKIATTKKAFGFHSGGGVEGRGTTSETHTNML